MEKGKSIVILFILLGLLFLANNLNLIHISLGELIRVYWPIIFIWIGVDKLLRKSKTKDQKVS
jgi:lia operon protein LiaF